MAERAVFLDRDNTIIQDDGYLGDPAKVKLLPGAGTALTSLRALGYRLIVVSNQSGVARGMFKEADVEAVNDEMSRQLRQQAGAYVDASYYCPFHPEAPLAEYRVDHDWRKPKPGMILQAAADFGLDLAQCWMVGDSWRDVAAGAACGCRTILVRDPERKRAVEELKMEKTITPNFVVASLSDAARIIVREGRHGPPPPPPAPPPPDDPPAPVAASGVPPVDVAVAPVATAPAPLPPAMALSEAPQIERRSEELPAIAAAPVAAPAALSPARTAGVDGTNGDRRAPEARMAADAGAPLTTMARGGIGAAHLEKQLDDLIVQLRQQNRNAELRPDFSLAHVVVLIVQTFALFAWAIGLFKYFTMRVTFIGAQQDAQIQFAMMAHLQAIFWIMVAVFLQGGVVALLLFARNR